MDAPPLKICARQGHEQLHLMSFFFRPCCSAYSSGDIPSPVINLLKALNLSASSWEARYCPCIIRENPRAICEKNRKYWRGPVGKRYQMTWVIRRNAPSRCSLSDLSFADKPVNHLNPFQSHLVKPVLDSSISNQARYTVST